MSFRPPSALRPLVATLLLALALPLVGSSPAAADRHCTTQTPTADYSLTICLSSPDVDPASGLVLSGQQPLDVQVYVTPLTGAALPSVAKVVFRYRGEYLLTDFNAPYGMTWRTDRMVDGNGTLDIKARLSDGRGASHLANITLSNGRTASWANTEDFRIRTGTTPDPGQRFRLVAVGDGAGGTLTEKLVAARVAASKPNMVAYLGDVYDRGSAYEFDNWFDDPAGFGQFRSITNPTVGNHEYVTPGASGYFDYWDNVPHYYSFDVAGWHVVTIDTTGRYNQRNPGTEQYEWLAADLGANRSRCTLVYLHHPRFSLGRGGGARALRDVWALLADRGVTLAVAGHAHRYERWVSMDRVGNPDPTGVTHMIAGAGGHELSPGVISDGRVVTSIVEPGALQLDLGADDANFSYINADGTVRDSGTVTCKSSGDPLPPHPPGGVVAQATSESTATVSWQPTTDVYGSVAGYRVRRDGAVVASLGGEATSYAENGLLTGQTYTWTVEAMDDSDNVSAASAAVSATLPAPPPPRISSRALLNALPMGKEMGDRRYAARRFARWLDTDRDGCNTRAEVLLREAATAPSLRTGCRLRGGTWRSRLDGRTSAKRSTLGIEHLVPLREAWQSGARRWTPATRKRFANDLIYAATLNVSSRKVLASRGDREPHTWQPPAAAARCTYAAEWVSVKWRWKLRVDRAERRYLVRKLRACGWPLVDIPTRGIVRRS